jgi:hypothetical protein
MRRLTTGIRYEKCIDRRFRRCANVTQCTYTNLDSTVYPTTHLGYTVWPIVPRLQTCTACYCTEYCRPGVFNAWPAESFAVARRPF